MLKLPAYLDLVIHDAGQQGEEGCAAAGRLPGLHLLSPLSMTVDSQHC